MLTLMLKEKFSFGYYETVVAELKSDMRLFKLRQSSPSHHHEPLADAVRGVLTIQKE
jgi:hypothetical protein